MKLIEYLKTTENSCLAKRLNVHPSLISRWKNGVRPIPVERMADIERATNGLVTRKDLCENWRSIWPELAEPEKQCSCVNE